MNQGCTVDPHLSYATLMLISTECQDYIKKLWDCFILFQICPVHSGYAEEIHILSHYQYKLQLLIPLAPYFGSSLAAVRKKKLCFCSLIYCDCLPWHPHDHTQKLFSWHLPCSLLCYLLCFTTATRLTPFSRKTLFCPHSE